jgi:hypothetical protein
MKTIQRALYVLIFIVFCLFLSISIASQDWSWFARSGSLITIIPMLISIIEVYSDRRQIYFSKYNYAVQAPDDVEQKAEKYWPIKILVNALITIIGTVIWGFGDLIK